MSRLLILFVFLSSHAFSQLSQEELVFRTLEQLEISKAEVPEELYTSRNFGSETLLVIPVVAEEGDGYAVYDAYLVLAENVTGKIVSKYIGNEEWSSDAVRLLEIKINPEIYDLGDYKEAFGVEVSYEGSSRPNPYSSTQLSLYENSGNDLKPVLQHFEINYQGGETDANCNEDFETITKSLEIAESRTEGYADLNFIVEIENSISTDTNCESTVVETLEKTEILRFSKGRYE